MMEHLFQPLQDFWSGCKVFKAKKSEDISFKPLFDMVGFLPSLTLSIALCSLIPSSSCPFCILKLPRQSFPYPVGIYSILLVFILSFWYFFYPFGISSYPFGIFSILLEFLLSFWNFFMALGGVCVGGHSAAKRWLHLRKGVNNGQNGLFWRSFRHHQPLFCRWPCRPSGTLGFWCPQLNRLMSLSAARPFTSCRCLSTQEVLVCLPGGGGSSCLFSSIPGQQPLSSLHST